MQEIQKTESNKMQLQQQNAFSELIKTKEEAELVKYISQYPLVSSQKSEDKELLIETIFNWAFFHGLEIGEKEVTMIVLFIQNSYAHLTVGEIMMAIELSAKRELDCEVEAFNNFSPMYVGRILNAYLFYRKKNMTELLRRKEKKEEYEKELQRKPSPEQQAETMKEYFIDAHSQAINKGELIDPFNVGYNFLRKHKILKVNQQQIDEAREYGKKKYTFDKYDEKTRRLKIQLDETRETDKNARNFLVVKFLLNLDINKFISDINSTMFVN